MQNFAEQLTFSLRKHTHYGEKIKNNQPNHKPFICLFHDSVLLCIRKTILAGYNSVTARGGSCIGEVNKSTCYMQQRVFAEQQKPIN